MLALGIESSCDETSIALLDGDIDSSLSFYDQINNFKSLGSIVASQIQIHAKYGGVIPEIGARQHSEQIHWLFLQVLNQATKQNAEQINQTHLDFLKKLDYIFVTNQPGLISGLRVGMEFAKTLQFFIHKKTGNFVEIDHVNHLNGHLISCFYQNTEQKLSDNQVFPHLHLLVSGGNTRLILLESPNKIQIVGKTLDDAAGECFDKCGRMLGFPYPGGIYLAKTAQIKEGNPANLPIGMNNNKSLDFSFSGLKTAVRYYLQGIDIPDFGFEKALKKGEVKQLQQSSPPCHSEWSEESHNYTRHPAKINFIKNTAISIQTVIIKQLINKFEQGIKTYNPKSIGISGGVSANALLRQKVEQLGIKNTFITPFELTGDNAIMIILAGITGHLKK